MDAVREKNISTNQKINANKHTKPSLYQTVWRWHFYAGMLVAPFMIILAITGGIYLFKPMVEEHMQQPYQHVQVGAHTLTVNEQIDAVKKNHPEYTVTSYGPPEGDGFSARIGVTKDFKEFFTVFVNPYDGQTLGEFHGSSFMALIRKIHGTLLIGGDGGVGDTLIELAGCWGFILLITGLYLWFPRGNKSIFGTLLPRFNNGKRVFWRDLHSVPAFWVSIIIFVLVLSGLPWTGFYGDKIIQPIETKTHTGSPLGTYPWEPKPQSMLVTKDVTHSTDTPWAIEKVPVPKSTKTNNSTDQQPISLEKVIQIAKEQHVPSGYNINFPEGRTGVYSIFAFPPVPTQQVTLHIDQYSGKIISNLRFKDFGIIGKIVSIGVAVHEGHFFGTFNLILCLLGCLVIILMSVSGYIMWWKRRPKGKLGVPSLPKNFKLVKGVAVIFIIFGILFPLVGVSLLIVWVLDWLIIKKIPKVKQWVG